MSRSLILSLVLSLCACGGAGRCVTNNECPVGASCDSTLGVCVVGGSSNLTSGSSFDAGVSQGTSNYAHACQVAANCADVPGTTCELGMCVTSCGGGRSCGSGTLCVSALGTQVCARTCDPQNACRSGTQCNLLGLDEGVPTGTHACVSSTYRPPAQSPIGGTCVDSGDCAGSASCLISSSSPAFCTMDCGGNPAVCGTANVCVRFDSTLAGCFAQCASPGSQSTCRSGFRCTALTGKSYGACI